MTVWKGPSLGRLITPELVARSRRAVNVKSAWCEIRARGRDPRHRPRWPQNMPDGPPKPKGSLYQQYMAIAPRNRIILGVAGVGLSITGLYLTEYSQKPTRINNEFYSDGRAPVLPSVKRDR